MMLMSSGRNLDQDFQGFLVASSVCSGFGTPTLWQGETYSLNRIKKKSVFRNLNSATLNAVKGEKCHLDFGGRVEMFCEETGYLQDRLEIYSSDQKFGISGGTCGLCRS